MSEEEAERVRGEERARIESGFSGFIVTFFSVFFYYIHFWIYYTVSVV